MSRKQVIAMVLIGLSALVLIFNRKWLDGVDVNLLVTTVHMAKSVLMLGCMAMGVLIGALLK